MQVWRAALKVAAGLCGWDSSSIGYESELVQTIIQDILHKRIPSNLNISIYPLGYDVCHEYLCIFLQVGSNDVLLVGIAGEAKMGKTVIAKAIYDGLFQTFDGSSLLIGVGQKSKEPNGMVQLQEKLLFDILGEKMSITSVIRGVDVIRKRLCHKKVLIILDDVDDLPELFALVGSRKWFGLGSKIIITSRDSDLLRSFEVDQLFMANGLTLPLDIQEIWEPYSQSCHKIAGLKQYIQSFSYWTNDKVKYLEESLIRELRKGEIQKQIICELQRGKGEGHASHSCTSLEEVENSSGLKSEKKRLTSFSVCQGNNEIRNDGLKTMIQTANFAGCTSSSDLKVPGCMLRPHNKGSITLDASYKIANEVEQLKDKDVGLAVGTLGNTVAVGTIVDLGGLNFQIHGMPLGDENVCVAIVVPIQQNVRLPIPVDNDLETVGHAVGCIVAWPKNLVQWPIRTGSKQKMYMEDLVSQSASPSLVQLEEMKHKQPMRDESQIGSKQKMYMEYMVSQSVSHSLVQPKEMMHKQPMLDKSQVEIPAPLEVVVRYAQQALKDGQTISVPMPADIVGYEHTLIVLQEDIVQFGKLEEISATCIAIYLKYLYNMVVSLQLGHQYGFLDPCRMASQSGNSQDDRACYLADELKRAHAGQLYFLPYNFGAHWVLVIINPCSNCVYFFDSMQQPICDGLKNVVESGLQMCGLKQKLPIWEKVKCPHQLTSTECGFYVMRYMKEIIDEQMHAINLEFNGKNSYTKEEIDEVRAEWGIIMQAYI